MSPILTQIVQSRAEMQEEVVNKMDGFFGRS